MTESLALFLAHAIALETEAGERYEELAGAMEMHNNQEVAALFRRMAEFSRLHAAEVRARAECHSPLPRLHPWEFRWNAPEPPESGDLMQAHYLMTPYHAIAFALGNERRGWEYYDTAARSAVDPEIRPLAQAFADEEAEHVATLERWLSRAALPDPDWDADEDPPVVVD